MGLLAYASTEREVHFERTNRGSAVTSFRSGTQESGHAFHQTRDTTDAGSRSTLLVDFLTEGDRLVAVPIGIVVERHGDYVSIANPETGIFGVGATAAQARADCRRALFEHRDVLRRAERLSPSLQAQLGFLEQHLAG